MSSAYWLPHTSSVDFCEPNYYLTDVAVEPWNAASSLFFSIFGFIGLLYSNPTKELRVMMLYLLLIVIGLGSTALHASLHWFAQSLDELPMLWFNIFAIYFLATLHTPLDLSTTKASQAINMVRLDIESGQATEPAPMVAAQFIHTSTSRGSWMRNPVGVSLSAGALGLTYAYYNLQEYYGVFIGGYAVTVGTVFAWTVALTSFNRDYSSYFGWTSVDYSHQQESEDSDRSHDGFGGDYQQQKDKSRMTALSKTCIQCVMLAFGGVGFSCWLIDMRLCDDLLPFYSSYLGGMTLHVIWHLGAAFGGYMQIQTLILLRARAVGVELHLQWPSIRGNHPRHDSLQEEGSVSDVLRQWQWLCFLPVLCKQKTRMQKSSSASKRFSTS